MHHPELPIVSFLCVFMVLSVLPSHIRAGSVATIALIAWLSTMSLIRGINSLVWADNFEIKIPVWCDITTKLSVGFTIVVPAAALCVLKHLESIASARTVGIDYSDKRKRQIFEAVMCFGLPALFMALHYIVQGHRFDLYEDLGCEVTVYYSVAGIFLYYGPPLLMSSVSFVFAVLSLYHFLRMRINFSLHLSKNNSSLSPNRYFRLMAMAVVVNMWDAGINTYILIFTNQLDGGPRPWISWANVHSNWSFIAVYPITLFPPALYSQLMFVWWIVPISCFIFFIFFGFGSEVQADRRAAAKWVWTKVFRRQSRASPVLPIIQSNPRPLLIGTPTLLSTDRKPWTDSVSSVTTHEVRPALMASPSSRATSMISPSSPTSSINELTSATHPYSVLPDDPARPSAQNEPSSRHSHDIPPAGGHFPENVSASFERDRFLTYTFPRPQLPLNHNYTPNTRPDVRESPQAGSPAGSRQTWYSTRSHDTQNQSSHHLPNDDGTTTENDTSHDFEVVSKTLSIEFVPRSS